MAFLGHFEFLSRKELDSYLVPRPGEVKLGEKIACPEAVSGEKSLQEYLEASEASYVVIGVPESIGPRANYGRAGAESGWAPFLGKLLNMQSNRYLTGDEFLVLGKVNCSDLMEKAASIDFSTENGLKEARVLIEETDRRLVSLISLLVRSGKIPVVIGGGHNNAYPCLRGSAEVLREQGRRLNCINCDPHADFREREGRHSGNGFSYAFHEGYLNKYAVLGLHESYNSESMLEALDNEEVYYETFDAIKVSRELAFSDALHNCLQAVNEGPLGLELDTDSICDFPVSAETPSGFSPEEVRQYVAYVAARAEVAYLHICEAAPSLREEYEGQAGKMLAYLVTDFMKANKKRD